MYSTPVSTSSLLTPSPYRGTQNILPSDLRDLQLAEGLVVRAGGPVHGDEGLH